MTDEWGSGAGRGEARPLTAWQEALLRAVYDSSGQTAWSLWVGLGREDKSIEAVVAALRRLAARGLVQGVRLHPARGVYAPYCWLATPAGATWLGHGVQGLPTVAEVRARHPPGERAAPLQRRQRELLGLLYTYHQVTTAQVAVWRGCAPRVAYWQLRRLEDRGYVVGAWLDARRPHQSLKYWVLGARGAAALAVDYRPYLARRPSGATLAYRDLQLRLLGQVERAGWRLYPPGRCTWPANPDVRALLVRAVLAREQAALARQLREGRESEPGIRERLRRFERGGTGGLVPLRIGDYVAQHRGYRDRVVVLVLQPPGTGLNFWRRPPDRSAHRAHELSNEPRLERWKRLAAVLPVYGVFPEAAVQLEMERALAGTALHRVVIDEVGKALRLLGGSAWW